MSTTTTDPNTPTRDPYPTRTVTHTTHIERREPVVWPGTTGGPLLDDELRTYDRNGFLTFDRLIEPDEVVGLRAELDRMCADPRIRADERTVGEPDSDAVRSIFEIHRISDVMAELVADPRLVDRARQILGTEVYIHQSRANLKPGFDGSGFYWHSDFETWHAEDGMPAMRAVSISIALTDNYVHNGALMIMPGSHRTFVACPGETPDGHYRTSLRRQQIGTPDPDTLTGFADRHGISVVTGAAGSATMFDSNCMHGSAENITPFPRANLFVVYNSVDNALTDPYAAPAPRPDFIASRETPLRG
ncbi:ectoine hydroxylase [Streptomyces sp. SID3343]|uniref:ectoine hydroxylase n=1 Tax=Streptomyces sp. SID3343 TaxID=2690260 RepID=UPI00136E3611|nr:ectoine hydroxylase [Streptomyces sp. SID3343]